MENRDLHILSKKETVLNSFTFWGRMLIGTLIALCILILYLIFK